MREPLRLRLRLAAFVAGFVALLVVLVGYVAEREIDEAARGIEPGHDYLFALVGGALLGLLAIAAAVQWSVFRPLREFGETILRREQGDPTARLGWGRRRDEIGVLGHGFDAMLDALEAVYARTRQERSNTIEALAAAVDAKDPHTRHHSEQVAAYARRVGQALGVPPARLERLYVAGLLHDVGKIAVPDHILLKEGKLTAEEFEAMKAHPAAGEQLVRAAGMADIAPWIRAHHERCDGRGYPDGLAADQIPLEGKILFACEALDAMLSERSYKKALSREEARRALYQGAGVYFDPDVVHELAKVLVDELAQTPAVATA